MGVIFAQPIEQYPNHMRFSSVPTADFAPDALFPLKNLLSYDPTQTTRWSRSSVTLTWDFGVQRLFNLISLLHTNTSQFATLVISASNDGSAWTTLQASRPLWAQLTSAPAAGPYAEDADPRKGSLEKNHSFWYTKNTVSYRYIRLAISDSGTPALSLGRLFVGRAFEPKVHMQYGSSLVFGDTGKNDRTDQGALIMSPGKTIVGANVKMDFLSTDELYDFIYDFNYWRQSARELFCCLDPYTPKRLNKNILYCYISGDKTVSADAFEAWSQTWKLEAI